MGLSRIVVDVVGNHGCDRAAKAGDPLRQCAAPNCIDCRARDFVASLRTGGNSVETATHTHWPGQTEGDIVDDLRTGTRTAKHF